jgi:hypothetical protein
MSRLKTLAAVSLVCGFVLAGGSAWADMVTIKSLEDQGYIVRAASVVFTYLQQKAGGPIYVCVAGPTPQQLNQVVSCQPLVDSP